MSKGKSIGIFSIKGGVGKTTAVINLAHILASEHNKKVAVVDANFSSPNISLHLGNVNQKQGLNEFLNNKAKLHDAVYEHEFGFHVMPSSFLDLNTPNHSKLKQKVNELKSHYDIVLLDSSPSLNGEMAAAMQASDELYVMSTPDLPTLTTTIKAVHAAKAHKIKVNGLIVNKVKGKSYELKPENISKLTGLPLVGVIKDNFRVQEALSKIKPLTHLNQNSNVSISYRKLAAQLVNSQYKEPSRFKKIIGYLKDDFSKLTSHKFSKGIFYYK